MLLSDDPRPDMTVHQDLADTPDLVEGVEVVDVVVEAVHPVLVDGEAGEDGGPAGGAAADRGEGSAEQSAPARQAVQMWGPHHGISQGTHLHRDN